MFTTVQSQLHVTKQKLEGKWEICVKSLLFLILHCSVLLQISIGEMIYTV